MSVAPRSRPLSSSPPPPPRPSSPPRDGIRVVHLPDDVRVLALADESREAVLSVLRGIDAGWTKRELAQWLAGPYRRLTSFAALREVPDDSSTFRRPPKTLVADKLEAVLRATKEEVLATLILAAPPDSDVRFSQRAIAAGHVIRTRDASGRAGWAPFDAPGMIFSDRIVSLVSVDYLMRPADYLALLSVCGLCQAVSFDAQVRVGGHCTAHRRSVGKIGLPRR
jgi:hypothetical protein